VITKYFRFFFLQQMWGKRMCRPIRFIAAGWSGSMRVQLLFSQSGQLSWEHWVNKRGSGNRHTHTHTHTPTTSGTPTGTSRPPHQSISSMFSIRALWV